MKLILSLIFLLFIPYIHSMDNPYHQELIMLQLPHKLPQTTDLIEQGIATSKTRSVFDPITDLHYAVTVNYIPLLNKYIQEGINLNAQDDKGNTVLHKATFWGNPALVKILLKNGASKTITNKDGKTPVILARRGKAMDNMRMQFKQKEYKEIQKLLS